MRIPDCFISFYPGCVENADAGNQSMQLRCFVHSLDAPIRKNETRRALYIAWWHHEDLPFGESLQAAIDGSC